MDSNIVLHKTRKGLDEVKTRRHKLANKGRLILLLVDGNSTVEVLRKKIRAMPDLDKYLVALLKAGFIGITDDEQPVATETSAESASAKGAMIEAITSVLGRKIADPMNGRFIYGADTPEQMQAALQQCCQYVALTLDEDKAQNIKKMGEKIIADWSTYAEEKAVEPLNAKQTLIEHIVSVLGEDYGDQIEKYFEPISEKPDDLSNALVDYCRLVTITIDEEKSKLILRQGKQLLVLM